ncbi:MAG: helix-turn-helix domain-containing protein [Clostridiales bacterium]|nr:helix-turn-helix domain-containing protein [Clostridiales bacterium]
MLRGKEIQRLRKARNMTQGDVADALGVTRGAVGLWENGKRTPNGKQVAALARLFNVPLEQLWDGEPERPFAELRTETDILKAVTALVDIGAAVNVGIQGKTTISLNVDPDSRLCAALEMLEDAADLMDPSTSDEARQSNRAYLDLWLTKTLSKMERANDGDDNP